MHAGGTTREGRACRDRCTPGEPHGRAALVAADIRREVAVPPADCTLPRPTAYASPVRTPRAEGGAGTSRAGSSAATGAALPCYRLRLHRSDATRRGRRGYFARRVLGRDKRGPPTPYRLRLHRSDATRRGRRGYFARRALGRDKRGPPMRTHLGRPSPAKKRSRIFAYSASVQPFSSTETQPW